MTSGWTDMARTALQGARIWRSVIRRGRISEAELGFTAADVTVVSLLLDQRGVGTVICAQGQLAALLTQALADGADSPRRVLAMPDGSPHIRLATLREAGATPTEAQALELVYGLGRGFLLADCPKDLRGARLRPLSSVSAALWQCGLALVVAEGEAAAEASIVADLAQSVRGDWIDPLALHEQVQRLSARLKSLGHADEVDPGAHADRVAELEHEIASLKRAALVSQHLLLVDAVERTRGGA